MVYFECMMAAMDEHITDTLDDHKCDHEEVILKLKSSDPSEKSIWGDWGQISEKCKVT
jgi:hypothetical protein